MSRVYADVVSQNGEKTGQYLIEEVLARNLDELERLRVVDRTHFSHGPATYHLGSAAHGHLVCDKGGSVIEVPEALFAHLAETARRRYGFMIDPHRFAVTGLCADCR